MVINVKSKIISNAQKNLDTAIANLTDALALLPLESRHKDTITKINLAISNAINAGIMIDRPDAHKPGFDLSEWSIQEFRRQRADEGNV